MHGYTDSCVIGVVSKKEQNDHKWQKYASQSVLSVASLVQPDRALPSRRWMSVINKRWVCKDKIERGRWNAISENIKK